MKIWSVDADDIRTLDHFDKDVMQKTPAINNFLDVDRDTQYFIIATKGVGKTFLLTAKRKIYQDKGVPCLPTTSLRDMFIGDTIFSKSTITLFDNITNWSIIWSISILLAILKKLDSIPKFFSNNMEKLIRLPHLKTVSDFFQSLMILISGERQLFFEFSNEYNRLLSPIARAINKPIAIFLDKIDEYFYKHISPKEYPTFSSTGEISPMIWYNAQIGLVDAVYDLNRLNHHFKIFASIRKEAFIKLSNAKLPRQYRAASTQLRYSYKDLKEMFIKYIQKEDYVNLAIPDLLNTDPLKAFLGVDLIKYDHIQKYEYPFKFIYRHTLQRPRDFMAIGRRISAIRFDERTEEKIKNEVALETIRTIEEYLSVEVYPYIKKGVDVDAIFLLLTSNVMSMEEIRQICSKYNGKNCSPKDCKNCKGDHIFCELYKIGLLGYLTVDQTTNKKIQRFIPPGEKTFEPSGILPISNYYLIHPILYKRIFQMNRSFIVRGENPIGDHLKWNEVNEDDMAVATRSEPQNQELISHTIYDEDKFQEIFAQIICDFHTFDQKDPPPDSAKTREDIRLAVSTLLGEDNITILDLGCGKGPLIYALNELDTLQLQTFTYIGVNYEDVHNVRSFIKDTGFDKKTKKCRIFTFDDMEFVHFNADVVFIIDVLHHVGPFYLDQLVRLAVANTKTNKIIHIIETEKHREEDRFRWKSTELKTLFQGYDFLKLYVFETNLSCRTEKVPSTIASIKRVAKGLIGDDFKDRCLSIYRNKLIEVRKKIEEINVEDPSYEKDVENCKLILIERRLVLEIETANKKWMKT